MFSKADYCYPLPAEKIARYPISPRSHSKLLIPQKSERGLSIADHHFFELPQFLRAGDLLVFNDTQVIPARLIGQKSSGGNAEIFIETIIDDHQALARCKLSHARAGTLINIRKGVDTAQIKLLEKIGERWKIASDERIQTVMANCGHTPIPPYLDRADEASDGENYQTIYAKNAGAVAAPTAGLHFDLPLMAALTKAGIHHTFVTLHVGAGTFTPLRAEDIRNHIMHEEYFEVSERAISAIQSCWQRRGKIVAVGTTSLRALETMARAGDNADHTNVQRLKPYHGLSDLFIKPGFDFRLVERLITNFHQSASTLLILVSAFAGYHPIRQIYAHALAHDYRFLSYGDAMMLDRVD